MSILFLYRCVRRTTMFNHVTKKSCITISSFRYWRDTDNDMYTKTLRRVILPPHRPLHLIYLANYSWDSALRRFLLQYILSARGVTLKRLFRSLFKQVVSSVAHWCNGCHPQYTTTLKQLEAIHQPIYVIFKQIDDIRTLIISRK